MAAGTYDVLQGAANDPVAYLLTPANIILLFFIVLGPAKLLMPFHLATREMEPRELRATAVKIAAISSTTLLIAGLIGGAMMRQWRISIPVMEFAGGLIFLLIALKLVLAQYGEQLPPPAAGSGSHVMHLVFPGVVTPYGIAALIALMALSGGVQRSAVVLGAMLAVMALNLLAMLFVRTILHRIGPMPLHILAAILAVQQVALALQVIALALNEARVHGTWMS